MENELFEETVPEVFHENDLNSMYYSIENRSPFLDRELYELASSIPTKLLIRDGKTKSVLRDALKNIVPSKIIDNRTKVGFNAPILDLLNINDSKVREALLDDSPIFNLIKKDKIESLLSKESLPNSFSKFLFTFINAKIFLEK